MSHILDTNVVSELRKAASGKADWHVVSWTSRLAAANLFVSVITILELEQGLLLKERRDAKQGAILRRWFENQVIPTFRGRVLPIDTDVARCCARLHVPDPRSDRDALIAATALVHGMAVVTRNASDFAGMGVQVINPWLP